ncbi:MAG: hypothetical protein ACKVQB_10195 [Bacteroidia bacterium]
MLSPKIQIHFLFLLIIGGFCVNAQQPLLRFKPHPPTVDSFDFILSTPPFKPLGARISFAAEMRLKKNYTLKLTSSYMNLSEALWIETRNLEIQDFSNTEHFEEQLLLALIKRYVNQKKSRVYFGPYLALGIEARRTFFKMTAQVPNFKKAEFDFSTRRQSLVFAMGSTKLFSKRIIFDLYVALKYQYKMINTGNFEISGFGYKPGLSGMFGFTLGAPIGRKKI